MPVPDGAPPAHDALLTTELDRLLRAPPRSAFEEQKDARRFGASPEPLLLPPSGAAAVPLLAALDSSRLAWSWADLHKRNRSRATAWRALSISG